MEKSYLSWCLFSLSLIYWYLFRIICKPMPLFLKHLFLSIVHLHLRRLFRWSLSCPFGFINIPLKILWNLPCFLVCLQMSVLQIIPSSFLIKKSHLFDYMRHTGDTSIQNTSITFLLRYKRNNDNKRYFFEGKEGRGIFCSGRDWKGSKVKWTHSRRMNSCPWYRC